MIKNLHLRIVGRVQGVGFRYSVKSLARRLNLKGYVMNMPDESVFIEVEGEDKAMDEFVDWCRIGPERAIVENINISMGEVKNFKEFETRFSY